MALGDIFGPGIIRKMYFFSQIKMKSMEVYEHSSELAYLRQLPKEE